VKYITPNPLHTAIALRGKNDLFAGVVLTEHLDADRQNSKRNALHVSRWIRAV